MYCELMAYFDAQKRLLVWKVNDIDKISNAQKYISMINSNSEVRLLGGEIFQMEKFRREGIKGT